jgi:hypothetical protein
MRTLSRKLVACATILALFVGPALPAAAHGNQQGYPHWECDGFYGFDHGATNDGGGWYHSLVRYINTSGRYTAIKKHYTSGGGILTYHHSYIRQDCGEGPSH